MADRPTFTKVFEEDESVILDRMLENVDPAWRTEPGDYMYDAIEPNAAEVKTLEIGLDTTLKNAFPQYAEGNYLDLLLAERGLTRGQATPNKRTLTIDAAAGVVIPLGYTLSVVVLDDNGNPLNYTADAQTTYATAGAQTVAITCETAGAIGNIPAGSEFILVPPIPGINAITDNGSTILGTDTETDEAAYDRYVFVIQNPDTGGNKYDYVRWAKEVTGVGAAKCIPKWNGNGTVKIVVVGTDFKPALQATVDDVQDYIDPAATGMGDGKAPCGAATTVIAATGVAIDISASVTYGDNYVPSTVRAAFEKAVDDYLASIVFTGYNVAYNKIAALLTFTDGVSNFTGLTVNGGTADVTVGSEAVAYKGTVTI